MTYYPTRRTATIVDIARIGVYYDEYTEKFRGTRYDNTPDQEAYRAAYRIINGQPRENDEDLVRSRYEQWTKTCAFTAKGQLSSFFKREIYMPKEERRRLDEAAVARMQERRDRKTFEELKKKYGW